MIARSYLWHGAWSRSRCRVNPPSSEIKKQKNNHNVAGFRDWVTHTQTYTHTLSWSYYNRNTDLITAEVSKPLFLATKSLFLSSNKDHVYSAPVRQIPVLQRVNSSVGIHYWVKLHIYLNEGKVPLDGNCNLDTSGDHQGGNSLMNLEKLLFL